MTVDYNTEAGGIQFHMPVNNPSIIKVVGVGGGGGNAVTHMFNEGIHDVTYVLCNTDSKALADSPVPNKLQMGEGLDDGDMLLTREVMLDGTETGGSLFDDLALLGGKAVVEALELIEQGSITPVKQDESAATHVSMISKELGRIDWSDDAVKIERYVRGLNPWPSAYSSFKGKIFRERKFKIFSYINQ